MKIDPTIEIMSAEGMHIQPKKLITRKSDKPDPTPNFKIVKCQEVVEDGQVVYSITEGPARTISVSIAEALREMSLADSPSDNQKVKPIMFEEMKKRYRLIEKLSQAKGVISLSELEQRYCEAALNHVRSMDECGFIGIYFEQQSKA